MASKLTIEIDEYKVCDIRNQVRNQIFEAADTYLNTKISPTTKRIKLSMSEKDERVNVSVNKQGQSIEDDFEGIELTWRLVGGTGKRSAITNPNSRMRLLTPVPGQSDGSLQDTAESVDEFPTKFELSFEDKHYQKVVDSYIPYILKRAKELNDEGKTLKIYGPLGSHAAYGGEKYTVGSLRHPSTFQTLAMDDELKKDIIDDLDRFVKRRDYYTRVGKAWKRSYLLYGPPGTGKSSLVAAMANHLNFDIYEFEIFSNSQSSSSLRSVLLGTKNRSIILIEDRSGPFMNKDPYAYSPGRIGANTNNNHALSGLLNDIDGLWSCCGDERIIVITTNHKENLDPALLLPGRMDKQIHMSYITPQGFRILASNYLCIDKHHLFGEIDELIKESQTTPAEVAQELMTSDDPNVSLNGLVKFLKKKIVEAKLKAEEEARQRALELEKAREQNMQYRGGRQYRQP